MSLSPVQVIQQLLRLYASRMKKQAEYEQSLRLRAIEQTKQIVDGTIAARIGKRQLDNDPEFELRIIGRTIAQTPKTMREKLLRALPVQVRDKVQVRMYSFEDLTTLPPIALQRLLRGLDPRTVALAIWYADETIVRTVMRNVSRRMAAMYREELSYLDAPDAEEVQEARKTVVRKITEAMIDLAD